MPKIDAIVLFSGGLDSILAARLLQEQGLAVRCLHFVSPFFGNPAALDGWMRDYGLDEIESIDIGEDFCRMLAGGPAHGFGKVLNPCVDCKILLLRRARERMLELGASFLASGEVIGQRPMSQRRDSLHLIQREAGVGGFLLRPLCAQHMPPTAPELSGLVRREALPGLSGRGRSGQIELARKFRLARIPTPAGGCLLTERENARSFWPLLAHGPGGDKNAPADAGDFALAAMGRQFWRHEPGGACWLVIGRNQADNAAIAGACRAGDCLIRIAGFPGPLGLARRGSEWPRGALREAAAFCASYSPKAVASGQECLARLTVESSVREVRVTPCRNAGWEPPSWASAHEAISRARRHPKGAGERAGS